MEPEGVLEMNAKSDTRISTENQSQDSQRSVYQESLAILDTGFGSFSPADKIEHTSLHNRNRTFEVEVVSESPISTSPILPRLETQNFRSMSSGSSFESSQYSRRESSSTALTATTYDPQESDSDDDDMKLGKLRYYIAEAEKLRSIGELKKAASFFRVIVKQLNDSPGLERSLKNTRLHYIIDLVEIQTRLKNWSDALITVQNMIGGSDDPALVGLVEHWQSWVYYQQGSLDSARSRCDKAIKKIKKSKGNNEDSVMLMLQILEDMGKQDLDIKEECEVEASFYRSLISLQEPPDPISYPDIPRKEVPDVKYPASVVELDTKSDSGWGPSMAIIPVSPESSQPQIHELSSSPSVRRGNTPVVYAPRFEDVEENRKILQQHGLDLDDGSVIRVEQMRSGKDTRFVAIREAIMKNDLLLADILFSDPKLRQYKMDVKYTAWGNDESQPLHFAVLNNNIDIVQLLLRKGVNILSVTAKWKLTALHIASSTSNIGCEMVEFLMDNGVPVDGIEGPESGCRSLPIHLACAAREKNKVELLIRRRASVNAKDFHQATPLGVAAMSARTSVHIKSLVDAGALVDDGDKEGDTPLHIAAANSNLEGIKILLECGANRSIKNKKGKRPLDIAKAVGDFLPDIKALLKPESKPSRRWF
ncbi:Palmitoyltransferase zdhhc13 [Arthrobotrys conoides]|uniref:Palmitoyltransferase zdhhc13 n=1 Tax=Arthrobotrys conoides TaxID=74498 RepID=A0AAN8RQH3_9PEZI